MRLGEILNIGLQQAAKKPVLSPEQVYTTVTGEQIAQKLQRRKDYYWRNVEALRKISRDRYHARKKAQASTSPC